MLVCGAAHLIFLQIYIIKQKLKVEMNRFCLRLARPLPLQATVAVARNINTATNSIYPDGPSYDWRMNNKMMIRGFDARREAYAPFLSLESAPFHPKIVEYLAKIGLQTPTNVQAQAWPMILSGSDSVCISKTGTGKSFAYMAPVFSNILSEAASEPAPTGPRVPKVLILSCERKQAFAIAETVKAFADLCGMKTAVVTGGYDSAEDVSYMKTRGADVLVATAGRCAKLLRENSLDLSQVKKIILDEGHLLLNVSQCTDTKTVLKSIGKDNLQTIVVGGSWRQVNRDYERVMFKKNMLFLQVLRPKRDLTGEPAARDMKTAQPSRRRRMLRRWKIREEAIREAEKLRLAE